MNFLALYLVTLLATAVQSDEQILNQSSVNLNSSVEESKVEIKSKDGDLQSLPSNQNSQYNSVYLDSKQSPGEVSQYSRGEQYTDQVSHQQPLTLYRPVDITNTGYQTTGQQQSSYENQEQQPVVKSYVRQPLVEEESEQRRPVSPHKSSYSPMSSPGISSTYTSPDVKIISHTRSYMPIVYKKQVEQTQDNSQNTEEEYDKAVQDRPGGSYAADQDQQQSYGQDNSGYGKQSGYSQPQDSYSGGGYRQAVQEDDQQQDSDQQQGHQQNYGNDNRYRPIQAHVQVIEESGQSQQSSYGERNQARPQYKNYRPSGYTPGSIPSVFDPPSPPLSALIPPPSPSTYPDGKQEDSYDGQQEQEEPEQHRQPEQTQRHPEQQSGGHEQNERQNGLTQNHMEVSVGTNIQDYGSHSQPKNSGYDRQRSPDYSYNTNSNNDNDLRQHASGDSYGRGQQKPTYSDADNYNNENEYQVITPKPNNDEGYRAQRGNDFRPQYNDERGPTYESGSQLHKPQDIEYGFIPLNEENLKKIQNLIPEGYGQNQVRGQAFNRGKPDEGYGEGVRGGEYGGGYRQTSFGPKENNVKTVGEIYGRGNSGGERTQLQGYGPEGYRGQVIGLNRPQLALNGYRKPAFERPQFGNGGEDVRDYSKDEEEDEEEEVENDDSDYGKKNKDNKKVELKDNDSDYDTNNGDKLPYECYPWNCNPWYAVSPHSPYNSVGAAYKGRGLPPGASYNPRDVGLDEAVVAQLNLPAPPMAAPRPSGIAPPRPRPAYGLRPTLDIPYSGSGPFPTFNGLGSPIGLRPQRPRPLPYSATGMGFRSQYGYRAAASEQSAQHTQPNANSSPVLSNLLNLSPIKNLRSLMTYITGGING